MTKLFEKVLARSPIDPATRINVWVAENDAAASLENSSPTALRGPWILDFSPAGERASHDFRKIAGRFPSKAGDWHTYGVDFPSATFNFAVV